MGAAAAAAAAGVRPRRPAGARLHARHRRRRHGARPAARGRRRPSARRWRCRPPPSSCRCWPSRSASIRLAGRATFSVLLFQDLAVAPILITLAAARPASESDVFWRPTAVQPSPRPCWASWFWSLFGRLLLRPMLRSVAKAKSEELFMAACLLVVIGAGPGQRAGRPVDGAGRLHRRRAAGRDRVSATRSR